MGSSKSTDNRTMIARIKLPLYFSGGRVLEEERSRLAHPHRRFIPDACIAGESGERGKVSGNTLVLFLYLIRAGPYKAFLNILREAPHHGGDIAILN